MKPRQYNRRSCTTLYWKKIDSYFKISFLCLQFSQETNFQIFCPSLSTGAKKFRWSFGRIEKQTKCPFEINWPLVRLFLINHALVPSARSKSRGEAWRCVVKNVMPQLFLSTGFSNPFSMWRFFAAYLSLQWHRDLRMMAVKKSYYTS